MTASQRIHEVLTDPAASHWLKHSLETALQRDMMDAANDAECLAELLNARIKEVAP